MGAYAVHSMKEKTVDLGLFRGACAVCDKAAGVVDGAGLGSGLGLALGLRLGFGLRLGLRLWLRWEASVT